MKHRIFKIAAGVFIIAAALLPLTAGAASFKADPSGTTVINDPVNDDLYSAGSSVTAASSVTGDAVLAGGNVIVNGAIGGGVLAAGGTLTMNGSVATSVRVAGGNIFIGGAIGRDVVAAGGQVSLLPSASVGRDLAIAGGTVSIEAPVIGNVYVRGGQVTINAPIAGSANIMAQSIVFGPKASIAGGLAYSSPTAVALAPGMVKGKVQYTHTDNKASNDYRNSLASLFALSFLIKIISLFALALIALAVFKKRINVLTQDAFAKFGWDVLHGFSALILIPAAAFVLLITVIGWPLVIIAIGVYIIVLSLAGIFAPILIGGWVWRFFKKMPAYPVNAYTILLGVLIYGVVAFIPIIGWLFDSVFVLAALGALTRAVLSGLRAAQK